MLKRSDLIEIFKIFFYQSSNITEDTILEFSKVKHSLDLEEYKYAISPKKDIQKERIFASERIAHLIDSINDYQDIEKRYSMCLDYLVKPTMLKARMVFNANLYPKNDDYLQIVQKTRKIIDNE